MIIYKRALGFLTSFLITALLAGLHYFPKAIVYFIILSIVCLFFYFWRIKNEFVDYKLLVKYFFIVLIFLFCTWLFFIVIDSAFGKYIILLYLLVSLIIIFDSFFKKIYQNKDITNQLILYIDLFCFWFIVYFLFHSLVFLKVNIFINSLILLLFSILLIMIRFFWKEINIKKEILHILVISIILVEIYLITSFLPFNFYSSAFILWIWYYLIIDFFVDRVKDEFIWSKKRKLIFFAVLLFILYLISVR